MAGGPDREGELISVIVPVYNGQAYLENCIRSIENQTYKNLEIIIVNDGSKDKTADVCADLQKKYGTVRVLDTCDQGVSAARNAGLDDAVGTLVTFVDADDRLHPAMLRKLCDCMERTGSDMAGCRFFMWSDEAQWARGVEAQTDEEETVTCDGDRYLRDFLLQGNSRCWSKLYRREAIGETRFREGLTIGEDMLFVLQLLGRVGRITETAFEGYGYYQNPQGAINRPFTPRYMDQITCWELAREEVRRTDESLDAQVSALCIMGIMLTAGKLAELSTAQRDKYEDCVTACRSKLKRIGKVRGVFGKLSAGYRLKAGVFLLFPHTYLHIYHFWRSRRHGDCQSDGRAG